MNHRLCKFKVFSDSVKTNVILKYYAHGYVVLLISLGAMKLHIDGVTTLLLSVILTGFFILCWYLSFTNAIINMNEKGILFSKKKHTICSLSWEEIKSVKYKNVYNKKLKKNSIKVNVNGNNIEFEIVRVTESATENIASKFFTLCILLSAEGLNKHEGLKESLFNLKHTID